MPYKAIFWDNDGVLVDTEHLYYRATRDVMAAVGVPLSEEQYIQHFLVENRGAWHLAEEIGVSAADIEALRNERNLLYGRLLLSGEDLVIAGVRDVLERLYPRYVMGIVTSSRQDHFDAIHRTTGLLRYFRFALTTSDYENSKPHPEPYLKALERSGCRADECLVVEDSERGLLAARAAGLRCIVVPSHLTRGRAFEGAYRVLDNLTQLLDELS